MVAMMVVGETPQMGRKKGKHVSMLMKYVYFF